MPNSKKRVFNMPKFKKEGYPSCLIQKRELSHMLNCIKKEGHPRDKSYDPWGCPLNL